MIRDILIVGSGSALGGIFRFLTGKLVMQLFQSPFPLGSFLVNISGSFLIGLAYAMFGKSGNMSPATLLFLTTGVLGGFTTFSAFSYENILLMRNGHYLLSISYIFGSILLGLLATLTGYSVAK
jgi:fluoride exporter